MDWNRQIAANHDGKGSLKRRNLYRNQEIMMAKGLFTAVTFAGTQEIMMAKGWNLYRNPRNNDGKGPLKHRTSRPGPEPANHSKSRGKGSLKSRILYRNQEIMMAKGLFSARIFTRTFTGIYTGTQEIMMAKGLFTAGTCGPEPANHRQSS